MPEPLVVVGAGGFGREVLDVAEAINAAASERIFEIVGVLDDDPAPANLDRLATRGVPFLGCVGTYLAQAGTPVSFALGIGSPAVRRRMAQRFSATGANAATLVHPAATIGSEVALGAGGIICAGARVATNVRIGRHVHLNPNVTVGHDSRLGDFVSMNPASSVSGDCDIGDGVLIGVGATVLNRLSVGADAVVGGAACVVKDVAAGKIVKGVPAR